MTQPLWIDSVPAWALGPRSRNAKFGGNIILAGIPSVSDRLLAVRHLSDRLGLPGDRALRSSGHILLEVETSIRRLRQYNDPGAIKFKDLKAGIRSGKYPRWVAMTAPQFGFKGAERGGMISKSAADRLMARDLHIEAITRSQDLERDGLGAGVNIWWPAWTSRKVDDPSDPPMDFQRAWDMLLEFWVYVLKATGGVMWLEWKPGDPGFDYLMTPWLANKFCKAVNDALGRMAMYINNEFAHILLAGISVTEGVQMTVDAGLFFKFLHANAGMKLPVSIQSLLDAGVKPENIPILLDADWPLGVGSQAAWNDQRDAIGVMDRTGQPTIFCEHDVNPSGLEPLAVFELSIRNRQKMLQEARAAA
ncbi:MAG: hypothetical protein WC845_01320 [Candidatus Staskawiczbacteria bacterium]|jgi:hypothetical protein